MLYENVYVNLVVNTNVCVCVCEVHDAPCKAIDDSQSQRSVAKLRPFVRKAMYLMILNRDYYA